MNTIFPNETLSFNEWAAYIKSEQMKKYSDKNKVNEKEQVNVKE